MTNAAELIHIHAQVVPGPMSRSFATGAASLFLRQDGTVVLSQADTRQASRVLSATSYYGVHGLVAPEMVIKGSDIPQIRVTGADVGRVENWFSDHNSPRYETASEAARGAVACTAIAQQTFWLLRRPVWKDWVFYLWALGLFLCTQVPNAETSAEYGAKVALLPVWSTMLFMWLPAALRRRSQRFEPPVAYPPTRFGSTVILTTTMIFVTLLGGILLKTAGMGPN